MTLAVPMFGFGVMDNLVMIQAGEAIDASIGVTFGLATMTSAAMGQIVSEFQKTVQEPRLLVQPVVTQFRGNSPFSGHGSGGQRCH